ncbi:HEAT repeat domain-containing protein [Streptomyces sp. NPDC002730]|uniref:HEAT repeat domain-containing protein n=1 Tax=Streptomyces sp. NPDC002730 TaxID=3364662 RepID=UPI0036846D48
MELARVFADLDSVSWAELEHAYGSAEDLPGVLRALAGDEEQAAEALDELWGSILHQGTVYAATASAVPFLAQMVAAGVRPVDLLVLLGGIAESEDEYGFDEPGACRAAVAAQLPLILPLIASPEADVRQAAVWTAGRTGAERALPTLRKRWVGEQDPAVRAELLAALVRLDPEAAAATALAAMAPDEPDALRIVAVLACLDAGLPWSPAHRDTMLSLLPADPLVSGRFDQDRTEPLHCVVDALLRRDTAEDRSSAYELIEAALRLEDLDTRREALWAVEHACMISRSAPARLAQAILALLADPSSTHTASLLPILDKLGAHAAPAAPALAALVAADGELADRALEVLVRVAPEQAAPLLARDLADRPRALGAACGFRGVRPAPSISYDSELLDAIRTRLRADGLAGNEPVRLTALLARWGAKAAAALPELTAALERFPSLAPGALAAVCPPESRDRTAGVLRRAAESGPNEGRFAAAEALRELTGEKGPLVRELQRLLTDTIRPETPRAAAGLGPDGIALLPQLRAALTAPGKQRTTPELNTDVQIALALWRLTGAADEAVPVLAGVLSEAADSPWTRWSARHASRAAAELGPEAHALAPALEGLLDDPDQSPAAILALLALGHDLDRTRAAGLLLDSAERNADPETALDALLALGPEALTPESRARLTSLAERDLRVVTSGLEPEIVPADERLRERARAILGA